MATARGPREVSDPGNVQPNPPPGAMKTDSPFATKEWSAYRSQGVLLRAPGDTEGAESFGIFPISDSSDNRNHDASIKIKKMTRIYDGSTKFPKLEECAHFHYDFTELGQIQVCLNDENQENLYRTTDGENPDPLFYLRVTSNGKCWTIRRNHENFRLFDKQMHRCIFDRKYSMLPELRKGEPKEDDVQGMRKLLGDYLNRFSAIAGSMINCGPVLSWLEMDNRGNRLIVTDDSAINTPAIAAAHATKRYNAHANDEISFEVGDIISIIDMPPPEETVWWRGKRGFEVGFFPSEYVEVIGDRIPPAMASQIPETPPKPGPAPVPAGPASSGGEPVLRKRGKLISFLRMFFTTRPTRTTLKRTGIVKERVFGCDLGEHLLNSGHDVPMVLKSCAELIETHGIVDGIYRLSGVASNIQKLRVEFDEDQLPDLQSETYLQDIHSISSLLKMYFRELPNPLLTYQLYDKFAAAVQDEDQRLTKLHDVIQQLPPPHYRTAEYLIRHLARVAAFGSKTGMHWKNLAIVWAPNLLRSKELETSCNVAALQGVGIQAVVTEYLIMYCDIIFSDKMPSFAATNQNGTPKKSRPKSLAVSTPTKLLSLEEARERALNVSSSAASPKLKYIDVGGGPETLPVKYHTVIDWPHKKKSHRKGSKSPVVSGWRSLFTRGRGPEWRSKQKYSLQSSSNVSPLHLTSTNEKALTEEDVAQRRKLRTVKSADSLLAVSLQPSGKPCETSVSATVDSSYASKPGEGPSHMRKPSETSSVTVQSEGGMRPLSKRSVSYDMYYSESDMEAADISPTEDVVFMTKSYTDADSHSSHSGWSNHGAVAMETSDQSYSRMADLEGRFYSHQRHQRHLSDSESIRSQGSYARAAVATGYAPSKSPTFKTFEGGSGRSPRSPRMYSRSKASRSFDGSKSSRGDMKARAIETENDDYYDAVSQILGTKAQPAAHGDAPTPSPHGGGMMTTFQPLPVTTATTITTSTSVPLGLSPEAQDHSLSSSHGSHHMMVSPRSPSLKERIVKALSPPALRKKMRSPSPSGEEPHSPVSSPPVAKSRKSRGKGTAPAKSPPSSPKMGEAGSRKPLCEQEHSHLMEAVRREAVHETHFDVNPQAKQLSPIGEMLPVVLQASPGSRRKNIGQDVSPYEVVSPEEEELMQARGRSPLPRLHPTVQPSGDELLRSLHLNLKPESAEGGEVSDYDNDTLEPPPIPPPRKRRSCEIPVTPGNEQYLNELETAERMLAALGSPQNRMSKALSVPSDLQRSRDTLDSVADMGSIGSFNELSKSLDSLLNGVHPHQSQQQRYTNNGGNQDESHTRQTPGDHQAKESDWSPTGVHGAKTVQTADPDYDLQFELETSPLSPDRNLNSSTSFGASAQLAKQDQLENYHQVIQGHSEQQKAQALHLGADISTYTDFNVLSNQTGSPSTTSLSPDRADVQSSGIPGSRPETLEVTSRSSSRSAVKSPAASDPCSPQHTSPRSHIVQSEITRGSNTVRSPAQSPDQSDKIQAENPPTESYNMLSPQSPGRMTSPSNDKDTMKSPPPTSPSSMSPTRQPTAESKRAEWVHAPKASMEETYIDTDSPPMVRKTAPENENVAMSGSVSPLAKKSMESLDSPCQQEDEEDFPEPPVDMSISASPEWTLSAQIPCNKESDSEMNTSTVLDDSMNSQPVNSESHSLNDNDYPTFPAEPEVERLSPQEARPGKSGSVPDGLDQSMEDEVFTMDMDESYEKVDTDGIKVESSTGDKQMSTEDVSTTKDDELVVDKKPAWTKEDRLDKVQIIPLQSQEDRQEVSHKPDPVANMKHMSRSYGGEHYSREEEDNNTVRARSCSSERKPSEARSLSKTPPAVLPKKSRYEKRSASNTVSSLGRQLGAESGQSKHSEGNDSDEGAVKYDDDKDGGRRQKKRHSPKRQKSVKELLSRFENITGSPPKEAEAPPTKPDDSKMKPLVFQKPKIVHLKSLSPTHAEAPSIGSSSPVPAPRKTVQTETSKSPRSPKPAPRSRPVKQDLEVEARATTSSNIRAKSSSPIQMTDSYQSNTSDRCDSDDADRALSGSEDSEGSERKVRKLSLMFERRNSARSDSLEPPATTLERRKRSDSGRSESPNETIREENANNKMDHKDISQSKLQKESDNEKISKQDTKTQEPRIESSSEKENISVRHLSQMFETGRASRSPSSEPADNNGSNSRGQNSRGHNQSQKSSKPWTAIV